MGEVEGMIPVIRAAVGFYNQNKSYMEHGNNESLGSLMQAEDNLFKAVEEFLSGYRGG